MENESANDKVVKSKSGMGERYPMDEAHLFVVTELAKLGMAYLRLVLPEFEKEQEGAGKEKRESFEHLKSLYEVAGPETVRHFDEMCQYVFEERLKVGG